MPNKALIPNPCLQPLGRLEGVWKTIGTHPFFPGAELHGQAVFEWIEGGAFLKMSTTLDHPEFPDGLALFGSDNASGEISMLYFDERGISRRYTVRMEGSQVQWWRDDPQFAQRFTVTIASDGKAMTGKGEMRRENAGWEKDLDVTYVRA